MAWHLSDGDTSSDDSCVAHRTVAHTVHRATTDAASDGYCDAAPAGHSSTYNSGDRQPSTDRDAAA